MLGAGQGWAGGYQGAIAFFDGAAWRLVDSPTGSNLYDLEMVSAEDGWMVGENGVILRYTAQLAPAGISAGIPTPAPSAVPVDTPTLLPTVALTSPAARVSAPKTR